jgi:uncharacterized membrane-anchored protein
MDWKVRGAVTFVLFILLAAVPSAQDERQGRLPQGWRPGPCTGYLGGKARIAVPDGYFFLDANATRTFLVDNQNVPDGDELGTLIRYGSDQDNWFVIFSYDDSGHVDDSDREDLDGAALLSAIQKGTKRANAERQKRGWGTMEVVGWHRPPFYDTATNNLTWAIRGKPSDGDEVVNRSVRLLGRTGVMSAQLVVASAQADATTAEFDKLLGGYTFDTGQRYAEFTKGDKVAGYGLAALVGAGAAGVAVKTGLFQKFWKLMLVGLAAGIAGLKRFASRLFRREPAYTPAQPEVWLPKSAGERTAYNPGRDG